MATDSNILAWEIPWTEGPSGLQSMGSQRSDNTKHACRLKDPGFLSQPMMIMVTVAQAVVCSLQ